MDPLEREHTIVGQLLDGKYRVERLIGQGGMGAVYLAIHEGTGRPVALKVITPELMIDEAVVERFQREARAAGQIRHPHVVNVTDFGFTVLHSARIAYLVMEHLEGQTLAELLAAEPRLPLAVAVDILEQTCSAVEEAHRHDIVHRDLKPENIWLERAPRDGYHVKVLDFGVAKLRAGQAVEAPLTDEILAERVSAVRLVSPDSQTQASVTPTGAGGPPAPSDSLTSRGVLIGTPLYMSPEQWLNRAVDARADVYALGVIAYRLFAGEPPFTGRASSLSMEHLRKPPPPLAARVPGLPPAAASVVMRALEKDAARRPPSVQAFAAALSAAAEGDGDLLRRAVTLTLKHFPALARVSLVAYGPILALALLRVAKCRLVSAGALPAGAGGVIGGVAIAGHALAAVFLVPVSIGLYTPLVEALETARPRSSLSSRGGGPSRAEILRCLRGSLVPTSLIIGFSLAIVVILRAPLEWLITRTGLLVEGAGEPTGRAAVVSVVLETLPILGLARAVRGFAVYPAVLAMEPCAGLAALRRSLALTRPCRAAAGSALVFHLLPGSIVMIWYMLALAQLSGLPYSVLARTSADTQTAGITLLGLYLVHLLITPFGMTALSLLYLKARRIEGASLDAGAASQKA